VLVAVAVAVTVIAGGFVANIVGVEVGEEVITGVGEYVGVTSVRTFRSTPQHPITVRKSA